MSVCEIDPCSANSSARVCAHFVNSASCVKAASGLPSSLPTPCLSATISAVSGVRSFARNAFKSFNHWLVTAELFATLEEETELDDVTDELATELEDTLEDVTELEDTADELLDGFTLALDATDEFATLLWLAETPYCEFQAADSLDAT